MSVIGDRTRQRRTELGLSQPELAERVGCKQQSIDQLERGEVQRPRYLIELAQALKTTVTWLQGKGAAPDISGLQANDMGTSFPDIEGALAVDDEVFSKAVRMVRTFFGIVGWTDHDLEVKAIAGLYHQLMCDRNRH